MPNPKRRHSKTRTAKRRTHDALTAATTACARSARSPRRRIASVRTAATTTRDRSGRSTKNRRGSVCAAIIVLGGTLQIRIAVDADGWRSRASVVVDGAVALRGTSMPGRLVGPDGRSSRP